MPVEKLSRRLDDLRSNFGLVADWVGHDLLFENLSAKNDLDHILVAPFNPKACGS